MGTLDADNFYGNWYGYVTNQAGHGYIVGLPAGYLAALAGMTLTGGLLLIGTVYLILWEWLTQRGDNLADSLEDTAHVVLGAALVMTLSPVPYSIQCLMLVVGVWMRKKQRR